ncbi:MAG: adenosylcobinamide-GDP ribazoletransferase [Hyphomicrobiales bacterium]
MISNNLLFKDLTVCVQFLSRFPIPEILANHDKPDFKRSSRMFPVAGFLIAIPAISAMVLLGLLNVPPMAVAAVTIAIQLAVTGALHEDGLADCADGFGGGRTREDKLTIMKDSRVGAFGVAASIMALILRFALLTALIEVSLLAGILAYLASQMLSRAVQVYFWQSLPLARQDGLAASFGQPDERAMTWALATGIISALTLTFFAFPALSVFIGMVIVIIALIAFRTLCIKQINGQTGDTIGAIQIITEIAFLIGLTTFNT